MNFIKFECHACNAQLNLDVDHLGAYCQYCGAKLMFDVKDIDKLLLAKERTRQAQEQTKQAQARTAQAQEQTKQAQAQASAAKHITTERRYIEEQKTKRAEARADTAVLFFGVLIMLAFIGFVLAMGYVERMR